MTPNPHAATDAAPTLPHAEMDAAHIKIDQRCEQLRRDLHQDVQSLANYKAMYAEQKASADKRREEAGRLRVERDAARAELTRLSPPAHHGAYHEDAGVKTVDDV